MRLKRWMGVIAALALLTWLVIPAIRIWRDPNLQSHRHLLSDRDPMKRLEMVSSSVSPAKPTRMIAKVFMISHKASFWVRYRSLLLGQRWTPGDRCEDLENLRGRIRPESEVVGRMFDQQIEADNVSIGP